MKKLILILLCSLPFQFTWGLGLLDPVGKLSYPTVIHLYQVEILSFSADSVTDTTSYRNPFQWPFSKKSIWNVPIGSEAVYIHAKIPPVGEFCPQADEDVIIMTPYEKPLAVFYSNAGWSGEDRCERTGNTLMLNAPIPFDFYIDPVELSNMAAAILGPDKTTILQTQPFAKCPGKDYATTMVNYPSVDLYGLGIEGAHGGSGLSSIGGTIRLGELVPGGRIQHALKCSVSGAYSLYFDNTTKGYRWPASKADDNASATYGTMGDPVMDCRMGALLAIPYWMDIDTMGFQTEPGLIIARACQEYGMYIVDSKEDAFKICTELSPEGRVENEFEKSWGYAFTQHGNGDLPWWQDMELLFTHLYVISNNTIDNVGGGGEFLAPEAPDFYKTYKLTITTEGAEGAEVSPSGIIEVVHGQKISIKVLSVPPGYMFDHWQLFSGEAVIADTDSASTTVTLTAGDAEIAAFFVDEAFSLNVYILGNGSIIKDPDQKNYSPGSVVNLIAAADSGWIFSGWSGYLEDTMNPVEIIMERDISVYATFENAATGIQLHPYGKRGSVDQKVSLLYDPSVAILYLRSVEGDRMKNIRIFNVQGSLLEQEHLSNTIEVSLEIEELPAGIYFIRIQMEGGGAEVHRIVK